MIFLLNHLHLLTFDGVSGQSELTDDVTRDVRLHQVTLFGVILGRLQQMVELLGVKLLLVRKRISEMTFLDDRIFYF